MPASFSPSEPDIGFTRSHHDCKIDDHPIGKLIPSPSASPSTQVVDDRQRSLVIPPGYPKDFKELIRRRYPQIALFVTTFTDATIVSWLWPHTLCDAKGMQGMVINWSRVLAGRSDLVDPLVGVHADVLQEVEDDPKHALKEPHVMDGQWMSSVWRRFVLGFLTLWDNYVAWGRQKRSIYVPPTALAAWMARARKEAQEAATALGIDDAFVSDGDIATAWLARVGSRDVILGSRRPTLIADIVNARDRLPFTSNLGGVLMHNTVFLLLTPMRRSDMAGTLGHVALLHRQSIKVQLAVPQLTENLRRVRVAARTGGTPPIFYGSPFARALMCNNVSGSNMMTAADFGPAVVRAGDTSADRVNKPGTATFYSNGLVSSNGDMPAFRMVWGKGGEGGLWMAAKLSKKAWAEVEADLAAMEADSN